MKALFWLLLAFAAAAAIAIFGRGTDAYALFVYPPWRVEVSLILFGIGAIVAFVGIYGVVRLLHHMFALPVHVREYRERRRRELALGSLAAALQAWMEGRYARAERDARTAYEGGVSPGLAALIAARAAHELRAPERRDQWLERARGAGDAVHAAGLVTQAELALAERDFGAAREALHALHASGPRHIATLRLLLRAELGAQNWEEVQRLATHLGKRGAIAPALADEYQMQARLELLGRAAADRVGFESAWRRIPERERVHPRVALRAAAHATTLGFAALARGILEKSLVAEWTPALVAAYAEIPPLSGAERDTELRARIEQAERWLRSRADDVDVMTTAGRLCMQAELWGKAQEFLEASVAHEETAATRLALGQLSDRLGRPSAAHYRRAAELAAGSGTPLGARAASTSRAA